MFRHPGYPEPNNCFLSLPQTDSKIHEASGQIVRGVHHKTALIACGILTGNAYCATYFALTRNAVAGVYVCLEDLLVEKEYYFIIPGAQTGNFLTKLWITYGLTIPPSETIVVAISLVIGVIQYRLSRERNDAGAD
ncbi:hypothetical protein HDV64DRAFT_290527 [Trichoderma sp. TUCIM 5745]